VFANFIIGHRTGDGHKPDGGHQISPKRIVIQIVEALNFSQAVTRESMLNANPVSYAIDT